MSKSDYLNDEPQITVTILNNGGVNVKNLDGQIYTVTKLALEEANLDVNNLDEASLNMLLQMTVDQNTLGNYASIDNTNAEANSTSPLPLSVDVDGDDHSSKNEEAQPKKRVRRKRKHFDDLEEEQPTSSTNPKIAAFMDGSRKLKRFEGVSYYKPVQFKSGHGNNASAPKFCCAVCVRPIPKSKLDFILLRLPAHTNCAKSTMMVLSDEEDDQPEEKDQ